MKILTMGSPASTYIFNQNINETYNGNYEIKRVREFYTIAHLLSDYKQVEQFATRYSDNQKFHDFLIWNFERGGFWGKLEEFQPDLLIADLFAEIFFGSFVLQDGTQITRNIRLVKTIPHDVTVNNIGTDGYVERVTEQLKEFRRRVAKVSPGTKLIINGARFPEKMSKSGIMQKSYDAKYYSLNQAQIRRFNTHWSDLDDALSASGFDVLKFDQKNNAAEFNFPTGKHYYYLYNQNYYTDTQSQIEMIAERFGLGPTTTTIDTSAANLNQITSDVIYLNVPNATNDLRIFRKDSKARSLALKLASQDYVLHGNKGSQYRFVKRSLLKTRFPKFQDVHYRIIPPKENKKFWDNRLLVRMFGFSLPYRTSIIDRNFRMDFQTLKDSVVKNTYILEIGDINLIAGSFYSNTPNYPNYENEIQNLIKHVAEVNHISPDNIVLYGTSRGATGALLHAALENYKFICADPVVNDTAWKNMADIHFVEGVRTVDLTDRISKLLHGYTRKRSDGILLGSSNVGVTFSSHLRLPLERFTLIDLNMELYEHGSINGKSVPIQLSFINSLLISNSIRYVESPADLPDGVVLEVKHLAANSINFDKLLRFRIRQQDVKKSDDALYQKAIEAISGKFEEYQSDERFEYFRRLNETSAD